MESSFTFTSSEVTAAQTWAQGQLTDWGIRAQHAPSWVDRGAQLLGDTRTGTVVLSYDAAQRLVSLDVWCDGRRLFGMDDLV